ncbi:AraC family transcriptional regulator [Rhizobium sp. CF142]|uniref:AraC family transcriptional regulator n=1 Tax=Rhizobium sp. CF142 TaxID=1144314 RepID=UPI00026EF6A5|nr:AraC family transcriptional regulator N-terminal domain-containing protein [Rhizobium sp. CF142]EJJ27123.1 transcriptional regulator containing an amidase domain and an AraC-type DNA-binding HTH domain [Rhizobium sp. CF142]
MFLEKQIGSLKDRCAAIAPAGLRATAVRDVHLFWNTRSSPTVPIVYEAGIVLLLGGKKHGRAGGKHFVYEAGSYLVLTLPLALECGHEASPADPLCGFFVGIDRQDLAVLLSELADLEPALPDFNPRLIVPNRIDEGISAVVQRLISAVDDPVAGRILGPSLRRELLFHVLRGPRKAALAALARQNGDEGRLDMVIRAVRRDISFPISVEQMARIAGMSTSVFHRAFRAKTGQSPLQYVKQLRLHKARDLINFEGLKIGDAARRVGYESVSQFSREYKRHFGKNASEFEKALEL